MHLSERLNFSDKKENSYAIEIKKNKTIGYYYNILTSCVKNLSRIASDQEIEACIILMQDHGINDTTTDSYYFWID